MKGIQFVVNDEGKRTAVLIDLEELGEIWEDVYDSIVALQHENDPGDPLEEVEADLRKRGKLTLDE